MGRDKAALVVPGTDGTPDESLAIRTARLLVAVAGPVLEVGPGRSGLPVVEESPPGRGPLWAVAAGWRALQDAGWRGAVVVVATDLPRLTPGLLAWLAAHPAGGSVVPVVDGRPQPLCARYAPADLEVAARLVSTGHQAMRDLLNAIDAHLAGPETWAAAAGGPDALADVDTPADWERLADRELLADRERLGGPIG
jgi:molybdopterin-guanine dinucleotide biosynthesis protein A